MAFVGAMLSGLAPPEPSRSVATNAADRPLPSLPSRPMTLIADITKPPIVDWEAGPLELHLRERIVGPTPLCLGPEVLLAPPVLCFCTATTLPTYRRPLVRPFSLTRTTDPPRRSHISSFQHNPTSPPKARITDARRLAGKSVPDSRDSSLCSLGQQRPSASQSPYGLTFVR